MNEQDTGIMENEIVSEEAVAPKKSSKNNIEDKNVAEGTSIQFEKLFAKAKTVVTTFKRPKLISLVILFASLVTIYAGLVLLSARQQKEKPYIPETIITSPTPQPPQDPAVEKIEKDIKEYNQNLDLLETTEDKIAFPRIDFEINF